MKLEVFTNTQCNLRCNNCSQKSVMRRYSGYRMSKRELGSFIDVTKRSKYAFEMLILSGGEPLIWTHINHAISRLKNELRIDVLLVITNGVHLANIDDDNVDKAVYYISKYPGVTLDEAQLKRLGPNAVIKNTPTFVNEMHGRYDNVLPADCFCRHPLYFDGYVYDCVKSLDTCIKENIEIEPYRKPFGVDYLQNIEFDEKYDRDACACCCSNHKIVKLVGESGHCTNRDYWR